MVKNSIELPLNLKALLPETLHALCIRAKFKKGTLLFETGKKPLSMFYVVNGEVTLERLSQQGDSVVLQRTRHGFVSEASLQSSQYHCDGCVVTDSEIVRIPLKSLAEALKNDPTFATRWISMLNTEVKRLRLQCERLSMKSVKDKVLHLINTEGKNGEYKVTSGLKSLAGELGVTHEALYRTLASLEKTGEVIRSDGSLTTRKGKLALNNE
jgi:CRP-like cAMP-binding protein